MSTTCEAIEVFPEPGAPEMPIRYFPVGCNLKMSAMLTIYVTLNKPIIGVQPICRQYFPSTSQDNS